MLLTSQEYHSDRTAVSKSWLDKIERSPAHLRYYLDNPTEKKSAALAFGSLVHSLVLEDDVTQYISEPKVDRRTKEGKEIYSEFLKESEGKIIVACEDLQKAIEIRDSLFSNKLVKALLSKGEPEQSIFWKDSNSGELCKARADWLRENCIIDLKTTEDASERGFSRSIANYRYHVQSAHYCEAFSLDKFVFIAVEKDPPYAVGVYMTDSGMLERGQSDRLRNLETYAECKVKNIWPSYPETIQLINLPPWA